MPDAWELTNGLNPNAPNASNDTDSDGITDYAEFVTGTLPQQPGSRFLAVAAVELGGVRLQSTTLIGRKYRIEHSTNLVSWDLQEEIIGDGNPLNRLIPVTNGQPLGFYHIIVSVYRP